MSTTNPVPHPVALTSTHPVKLWCVFILVLCPLWVHALSKGVYQLWLVGTATLTRIRDSSYYCGTVPTNGVVQKICKQSQ